MFPSRHCSAVHCQAICVVFFGFFFFSFFLSEKKTECLWLQQSHSLLPAPPSALSHPPLIPACSRCCNKHQAQTHSSQFRQSVGGVYICSLFAWQLLWMQRIFTAAEREVQPTDRPTAQWQHNFSVPILSLSTVLVVLFFLLLSYFSVL